MRNGSKDCLFREDRPMNSAQLINQDSGEFEYYTPEFIIEAARRTMGGIDLDPASSFVANERVRATRYFDHLDDSLYHVPPGSTS